MSRRIRDRRIRLRSGIGGERNVNRAEQLRAAGVSDRAVARSLGVAVEAVSRWFDLQDELVRNDVDGAA
jgi:hypothetical protein